MTTLKLEFGAHDVYAAKPETGKLDDEIVVRLTGWDKLTVEVVK